MRNLILKLKNILIVLILVLLFASISTDAKASSCDIKCYLSNSVTSVVSAFTPAPKISLSILLNSYQNYVTPVPEKQVATVYPTVDSIINKILNTPSLLAKLRGPTGPTGLQGPQGPQGTPGPTQPVTNPANPIVYMTAGVTTADPAHNFTGGEYASVANLTANIFTNTTSNITNLNVNGPSALSGTLSVTGSSSFGALTASTINGLTINGGGTLTIANGKTLTANNSLTFSGTDGTIMTFPTTSATLARTDAANTFTGHQTIEGVTSTGATGTGKFVFDTSPILTTPTLGAATATTLVTSTSETVPLLIGGTAVGSSLELRSTSGVGTTDFIKFNVGSNGATEAMRILDNGNVGIGASTNLSQFTVRQSADTSNIGGTTTANASTTITGSGTTFTTSLGIGDRISLSSASSTYATVTAIASDTSLTVDTALGNGTSQTINRKKSIFRVDDNTGSNKLVINDQGYIGIGVASPTGLLHIKTQVAIFSATGGTITFTDSNGLNPRSSPSYPGGYTVHTFTSGTTTFTPNTVGTVEYLVVGGGGGGGGSGNAGPGGGGGAGGFRSGSLSVTSQAYSIIVGGAGNAGANNGGGANAQGGTGGVSTFSSITAAGGGGGAGPAGSDFGTAGGSGGGSRYGQAGAAGNTPSTVPSQGNNGGGSIFTGSYGTGGGGGASAVGATGTASNGGNGGAGTASSITGTSVTYAGGGGGATQAGAGGTNGTGGAGGGGNGGTSGIDGPGSSGTTNRGGGGGGASYAAGTGAIGGAGGSGIVVLRYLTNSTGQVDSLFVDSTSGNVGIGTTSPSTDKLVVVGDIRIGITGSNGCIENFAGTALTGSCSSDINLKKNIVPITGILDKFTQLEPVTYEWRSDEFPERHFGTDPVKGLIAQQVEQLFPELVGTDSNGFKTLDYGISLQVMSIEAIKEMNLNLDAVAGTVVPLPGSASESFATAFFNNLFAKITAWLADAGNGVAKIFTGELDTSKLCVKKSNGTNVCIDGNQLDALLQNSNGSVVNNNGGNSNPPPPPAPDTTAPVITLTGDAVINLNVGDTYTEAGATATDDVDTSVAVVISGTVDTTTAGTYTIHYNATDTAGNHAVEVLRTVNVNPPTP